MMRAVLAGSVVALLASCAGSAAVSDVRFHNRPIAWRVADRTDVPVKPAKRALRPVLEVFDLVLYRRITRALAAPAVTEAADVNALDEVPDSSWFTNRIGRHPLTPGDVVRGDGGRGPDLAHPLVVLGGKSKGAAPGFLAKDHTGRRFLVKLDDPLEPTLGTGTHIVVNRLLWASGYNVPNDQLGTLRRDQLVIADDATFTDTLGRKRAMTSGDLDAVLASGARSTDGTYRVLFSELLPGEPLGGFSPEGTRPDDPNDTVPHERRRVLRGLSAIAGWLQHTDMRQHNTLDVYVTDPARASARYLKHYLIDFDKALGAWTVLSRNRPHDGHAELVFDGDYFLSAFAFGLWKRPWEDTPESPITGIAMFDSEHYDPGSWTPSLPYAPFLAARPRDMLWAVDIMLEISDLHIREVVRAAQFADARAVDALTAILAARRDKTARYWLARVNPLVRFSLADGAEPDAFRLCFVDRELDPRVRPQLRSSTRYRITPYDEAGRPIAAAGELPGTETCTSPLALAPQGERYTIVRIDTLRGEEARPPIEVHVARDPRSDRPRIIGLRR